MECLTILPRGKINVIMKFVFCSLVLLLGLSSCSTHKGFSISKGNSEYHSKTISSKIAEEYDLEQKSRIIVVLTQDENLSQYKEQLSILIDKIDAEEEGVIYVIGNSNKLTKGAYAITPDQTKAMLASDQFQIRIYNSNGKLKNLSQSVLSADSIKNVIKTL